MGHPARKDLTPLLTTNVLIHPPLLRKDGAPGFSMPFEAQPEEIIACLKELGQEYLRVGAEHCAHLSDGSQLSAFLLLGIRAISIANGCPPLLESRALDTLDVVRRGFLETCYLQHEFRLKESVEKAKQWLANQPGTWKTKFGKWEDVVLESGPPVFGPEYHDLSELAHPTVTACQNSGAVLTTLMGSNENKEQFEASLTTLRNDLSSLVFRIVWITLAEQKEFIDIHVSAQNLAHCTAFMARYEAYISGLQRNTCST